MNEFEFKYLYAELPIPLEKPKEKTSEELYRSITIDLFGDDEEEDQNK